MFAIQIVAPVKEELVRMYIGHRYCFCAGRTDLPYLFQVTEIDITLTVHQDADAGMCLHYSWEEPE